MKDFVSAERRGAPRLTLIFLLCVLCASPVNVLAPRENPARIALIAEGDLGDPGNFGADDLLGAFREKGLDSVRTNDFRDAAAEDIILAGIPSRATRLHDLESGGKISVPANPESYTIRHLHLYNKDVVVAAGSDERGLMYALLEMARRLRHLDTKKSPLSFHAIFPEATEKPEIPVRGMIQFLHSADLEREWYYDRAYWEAYLGMLARDRFNSFNLVFAHQTSYLAPPYPFLFTVEKYPQVKATGLSEADQKKNLETLQMISRMARERGIDFIMGIWEHRAWRNGQQSMVTGLTDDILTDYSRLAMEKLLRLCPGISGIQLRVNTESGIENERQTGFYRDGVLAGMKSAGRPVLLDLRGWGALQGTVDAAVNSGLPMRLSTKYWAEFMGMPYQAAKMLPSYSYADFLRYPRPYPVFYQVWSLGSHRLLPWGGVDWMKRFAPTTHLGDGVGFETCAPLSQKGFGNPPGTWRIFVSRDREYYRWEFERYWLYYLLYGRLSYNPNCHDGVWMDELRAHFGERAAPAIFDAFQAASQVLPFLVSYRLSNPNMYIWPEKQMGGLLDFYIEVKPADEARFASFEEYIARRLSGARSAKMTPETASEMLNRMAEDTERALSRAGAFLRTDENKEYAANRIDLQVLALLARYHAQKIRAGANLALFYASGDESALRTSQSHAAAGLEIWERLVRLTDGLYYPKMVFGPRDVGHWKDNLIFVRHDVQRLEEVQHLLHTYGLFDLGLDFGPKVAPRRSDYEPQYANTYSIERRFRLLDPETAYTRERGYGWLERSGITASPAMSIPYTSLEGDNLENLALPQAVLYRDFLRGSQKLTLLVDLPDGDYRITSIVANQPELAGGAFQIRPAGEGRADGSVISYALAETGDKSMDLTVTGGRLALEFVPSDGKDWLISGLILTRRAPHIAHVPIVTASPGLPLRVAATITAPDGVGSAALCIQPPGTAEGRQLFMLPSGSQYSVTFTPDRKWEAMDLRYFIVARDRRNRETRLPPRGEFALRVGHDPDPPVVEHNPVALCEPGKPLRLSFRVQDASELMSVKMHYRHLTQMEEYRVVDLTTSGEQYEAAIPGDYINPRYDLMYYLEAVDRFGNGVFYPNPDRVPPYIVVKVRR